MSRVAPTALAVSTYKQRPVEDASGPPSMTCRAALQAVSMHQASRGSSPERTLLGHHSVSHVQSGATHCAVPQGYIMATGKLAEILEAKKVEGELLYYVQLPSGDTLVADYEGVVQHGYRGNQEAGMALSASTPNCNLTVNLRSEANQLQTFNRCGLLTSVHDEMEVSTAENGSQAEQRKDEHKEVPVTKVTLPPREQNIKSLVKRNATQSKSKARTSRPLAESVSPVEAIKSDVVNSGEAEHPTRMQGDGVKASQNEEIACEGQEGDELQKLFVRRRPPPEQVQAKEVTPAEEVAIHRQQQLLAVKDNVALFANTSKIIHKHS